MIAPRKSEKLREASHSIRKDNSGSRYRAFFFHEFSDRYGYTHTKKGVR